MVSLQTVAKSALFTLVVPGTVGVWIPQVLRRREHPDGPKLPFPRRASRVAGTLSLLAGGLLYTHTAWRFADEGEGTPAPIDEPEPLVVGGIYAHVRNPMYVAVLLVILGQALLYRSIHVLWWAAGCLLGFHDRVVGWEEPHLAEKHGEAYERYCEAVPRWLPRLRPWTGE